MDLSELLQRRATKRKKDFAYEYRLRVELVHPREKRLLEELIVDFQYVKESRGKMARYFY